MGVVDSTVLTNWTDALALCQILSPASHLVSIESKDEQRLLRAKWNNDIGGRTFVFHLPGLDEKCLQRNKFIVIEIATCAYFECLVNLAASITVRVIELTAGNCYVLVSNAYIGDITEFRCRHLCAILDERAADRRSVEVDGDREKDEIRKLDPL